jgi:hypothetical protein
LFSFLISPMWCVPMLISSHAIIKIIFGEKYLQSYTWSIALYGAETWMLQAVDQKHLECFKVWCWRRMVKISWTNHARNEEVLLRVKEQRNILHEISKWKANWIGHILRRNCLLHVIAEKIKGGIEVTGKRGRRRRKLLNDLNPLPALTY